MAWHILNAFFEGIRTYSTFPGKLWIIIMFIFRIVIVARIAEHVYEDEQSHFICNTLTPGCQNVCYNLFRPISAWRFWSLMVVSVSTPGIFFFLYSIHKLYHAKMKFPQDSDDDNDSDHKSSRSHENLKRTKKRIRSSDLYEVKQMHSKMDMYLKETKAKEISRSPPKSSNAHDENVKELLKNRKSWNESDFSFLEDHKNNRYRDWPIFSSEMGYPPHAGNRKRKKADIQQDKSLAKKKAKRQEKEFLKNLQLYRAYWWHVLIRTMLEVAFLVGQYLLYGFWVSELFECERKPCVKVVDCYVSRPMEKTILIYIMFVLGCISCFLSIGEFYSLGWERFKSAVCRQGEKVSHDEKRRLLAQVAHHENIDCHEKHSKKKHHDVTTIPHPNRFTRPLSLSTCSSETTVVSI